MEETVLRPLEPSYSKGGRKGTATRTSRRLTVLALVSYLWLWLAVPSAQGRDKDGVQYGAGLVVNVPVPEAEVSQAVDEVVQNGIIQGTKEYNKDEYITGATAATSTRAFPAWAEGGKVFYKIRTHAIDPRNFKDGGDVGTLTVRYVVQAQGDKNTVLRIDAVFVEDFRHTAHASNGSVESSEYKAIHDHLESMESIKQQGVEAEAERQQLVNQKLLSKEEPSLTTLRAIAEARPSTTPPDASPTPAATESLEQHVQNLRRQVQRLVRSPGAPLKSAPFHTAGTLKSLAPGTEILVLISTPYWYGVETHDGQHGWIPRDQLEQLP